MKLQSVSFGSTYLSIPGLGVRQGVTTSLRACQSIELLEPACQVVRIVTEDGLLLVPWAVCTSGVPETAAPSPSKDSPKK